MPPESLERCVLSCKLAASGIRADKVSLYAGSSVMKHRFIKPSTMKSFKRRLNSKVLNAKGKIRGRKLKGLASFESGCRTPGIVAGVMKEHEDILEEDGFLDKDTGAVKDDCLDQMWTSDEKGLDPPNTTSNVDGQHRLT